MRRPVSAMVAAAFGVVGLVGLKTPQAGLGGTDTAAPGAVDPSGAAGDQASASPGGVPTGTPGPGPSSTSPTPGTTTPAEPSARTVTGSREAAGDYGFVQVQITVVGSELTDITLLEVTESPKRVVRDAPGTLIEEALVAQSADIENVSGATYTSEAFKESLRSALAGA